MTASKFKRPWIKVLQLCVVAILIYFVSQKVVSHWTTISNYEWHLNYAMISLSVLVLILALYIQSSVLARIFKAFSRDVGPNKAFKIAYLSQLGRYIPGKIWQVFGIVHFSKKSGIAASESVASFILHQSFGTPPALAIVALNVILNDLLKGQEILTGTLSVILIGSSAFGVFLLFSPKLLNQLLNRLLRFIGENQVTFRLQRREAVTMLAIYTFGWLTFGFAFYLFVISVSAGQHLNVMRIIGIYCAAYLIGFWSLLTPGGIGVREAVLTVLLSPIFGGGVAAAISAAARLWSIAGEILASLIALRIRQ